MPGRLLALAGLITSAAGTVAVIALHLVPHNGQLDPLRRTISEYALHDTGLVFNGALIALAIGSVAVLAALVRGGLTAWWSAGGIGMLLWCAGIAAVVYFPKHNWSVGPSASGTIHRVASLTAFIALPLAAIAIAWVRRREVAAKWTLAFAVLSLVSFGIIVGAFVAQPLTGVRWWRVIPLGLTERTVAAFEVATLLTLGWWASRLPGRLDRSMPLSQTDASEYVHLCVETQ